MEVLENDAAAAAMLKKLQEATSVDPALRRAAEEYIQHKLDHEPDLAVHSLLVVVALQHPPDSPVVQRLASLLLRRNLPRLFNRLSSEGKDEVRSSLLRALQIGPEGQGTIGAVDLASIIAGVLAAHGAESVPGISAAFIAMVGSNQGEVVVMGCKVLRVVLAEAFDAFASDVSEEALDALSRRLVQLSESADARAALAARGALMELVQRADGFPLPAVVDEAPRLLEAIIRAMREDGGDERDWDSVGGLRDISTFLSAFPRVGLDHTGDLLETVATALSAEERPPELMDLAGAVVEALSEALQQEHADSPAVRALVDTLPRFLPVLLQGTYYTEEDPEFERYLSLQESDGGAMQQEDEDEDEVEFDGEHAITPRKTCALMIHRLVEDRPSEVVPVLLNLVSAMLRAEEPGFEVPDALSAGVAHEEAWKIKEAGILAVGAVASAHLEGLEPLMPVVVPTLARWTRAEHPLVASMACWSLGQMAPYFKARVEEEGRQAAEGQLAPLLGALGPCINHSNAHVRHVAGFATSHLLDVCGEPCAPYLASTVAAATDALERPGNAGSVAGVYDVICSVAQVSPDSLSNADAVRFFTILRDKMRGLDYQTRWLGSMFDCEETLVKHEGVRADPELPLSLMDQAVRTVRENGQEDEDAAEALCAAAVDYICSALEVMNGRCAERVDALSLWELTESLLRDGVALGQSPVIGVNLLQYFPGRAPPAVLQRVVAVAVSMCHERLASEVAVVPWLLAFMVPVVAPDSPGAIAMVAAAAAHMLSCAAASIDAQEGGEHTTLALANAALALSAAGLQDPAAARIPVAGCIAAWLRGTLENEDEEEATKTWRGIAAMAEHAPEVFSDALPNVASAMGTRDAESASAGDVEAWERIASALGDRFGDEWKEAAASLDHGEAGDVEDDADLIG